MSIKNVQKIGVKNEEKVENYYKNQGYQVLNLNDKGRPDLLIIRDREIKFFVEVKGGRHKIHLWQMEYQKKLEKLGFKTVNVRILANGKIIEER